MTYLEISSSAGLDEAIEKDLRTNEEELAPLSIFYFESCSALTIEQTMALAKMLQKHHLTLGEVEFNDVTLELEGVQILSAALATMPSLTIIKFIHCGVCDEGAKVLADACVQMKALKELYLPCNMIGADGARAFAEALGKGNVERLELWSNGATGDEGAVALAKAVSYNTTLKELGLYANEMGREGAKSWVAALNLNSTLEVLALKLDISGIVEAKALVDAFERSDTLRYLSISPPACGASYHFDFALKEQLAAMNKYRGSPDWETHRILKKILQKQEEQGKQLKKQGTAIATLHGKVDQLMERDAEYVHIESSTRADIGE